MDWIGWIWLAFFLIFYGGYPERVKKLERKVKKLESQTGGVSEMSKMITAMIGKKCKIKPADLEVFTSATEMLCEIVDADEEWVKVVYDAKKKGTVTKLIRIDDIKSIEELAE